MTMRPSVTCQPPGNFTLVSTSGHDYSPSSATLGPSVPQPASLILVGRHPRARRSGARAGPLSPCRVVLRCTRRYLLLPLTRIHGVRRHA
jgi:hypothetical protein